MSYSQICRQSVIKQLLQKLILVNFQKHFSNKTDYLAITAESDWSLICSGTLTSSTCKSHTEGGPAHSPHEGGILIPPGGILSDTNLCEFHRKSLSISLTYIFEEEGITIHPGCRYRRRREGRRERERERERDYDFDKIRLLIKNKYFK